MSTWKTSKGDISRRDIEQWLMSKTGEYEFGSTRTCLVAQFLTERGFKDVCCGAYDAAHTGPDGERVYENMPLIYQYIASGHISYLEFPYRALAIEGHTFEAALSRANLDHLRVVKLI